MYLLNAESVNSIKDAVHYYDCATEKVAYETVGKLEGDVVILTKDEVKKLKEYILEMEDAVFNGAFAPPTLSFLSQLCDFAEKKQAYVEDWEDDDIRSKTIFSTGVLARVNELLG